jgi:hypothetical protein
MAPLLGTVERWLEQAFEAPARRLFRPRLEPITLARAIERAMEQNGQVGPSGLQVPNYYLVELHPSDFSTFEPWLHALERDLAAHVQRRTLARAWACPGRPRVELRSNLQVARRRPAVHAEIVDAPAPSPPSDVPAGGRPSLEGTAVLPLETVAAPPSQGAARAWLELPDGRRIGIGTRRVRLGRELDNDVVLPDPRVSRYHAQIDCIGDAFTLRDLGSRNGTRVGDRPLVEAPLRPGDTIYLGGVPLRFDAPR